MSHKKLAQYISQLKNEEEVATFLEAVLTPSERSKIDERIRIFVELLKGQPQRQIAEKLDVSITSVTRGSRVLKYDDPKIKEIMTRLFNELV